MTAALLALLVAFPSPAQFDVAAAEGGASGMRFTGSPRSKWDCRACHVGAQLPSIALSTDPGGLLEGGYEPGRTYTLTFSIPGAPKAAGLAVDAAVTSGAPLSGFANASAVPPELRCEGGGDPVEVQDQGLAIQTRSCGVSTWKLAWTAPSGDVGPVTIYAGAVSGNFDGSLLGDEATAASWALPRAGGSLPRPSCGGTAGALAPLLLLAVVFALRRRRLSRALVAVALVSFAPLALPEGTGREAEPAGVFARLGPGLASRDLSLTSASRATPVHVAAPAYFEGSLDLRIFPLRLAELGGGLFLGASHARGVASEELPSATGKTDTIQVFPARSVLSAGWVFDVGPLSLSPAASYGFASFSLEKNPLVDEPELEGYGAQLGLGFTRGAVRLEVTPRVARLRSVGLAADGYGPLGTSFAWGVEAEALWRFSSRGFGLSLRGGYGVTRASLNGGGTRGLGPVELGERLGQGSIAVSYER